MWPTPKHNKGEVFHLLLNYEKKHGTAPAKNKYKLSKLRNNREKFILELPWQKHSDHRHKPRSKVKNADI